MERCPRVGEGETENRPPPLGLAVLTGTGRELPAEGEPIWAHLHLEGTASRGLEGVIRALFGGVS